jgi:hypothetical protein
MSTKTAERLAFLTALAASTTYAAEADTANAHIARIRWAEAMRARTAAKLSATYAPVSWAVRMDITV